MKASELRMVRHLALSIAESVSAMLEVIESAHPSAEAQTSRKERADESGGMPAELQAVADQLPGVPEYFGRKLPDVVVVPPAAPGPLGAGEHD